VAVYRQFLSSEAVSSEKHLLVLIMENEVVRTSSSELRLDKDLVVHNVSAECQAGLIHQHTPSRLARRQVYVKLQNDP
jgi:hypothetical protein